MYACIAQQPLRDEVGAWQNNRKHRLSRRLLVSEAQIDNRQMSTVNCNSTSKDHDIAAWWTSQATAASAVIELPLKASNRRIVATDCTETVLICHERDLFFCRSRDRVQALDLRTARQSMQAKASSFGYKRYIYCTRNPDQVQDKVTATSNSTDTYGQLQTVTKSRKSPPVALLRYTGKRHMATTPPLQTPTRHAACRGRPQQFQTDSYGTCRQRHESHARRVLVARPLPAATLLHYSPEP